MSRVLLLQIDGSLPNCALMRLAAHHRALGDEIVFRHAPTARSVARGLWDDFDRVYASLIFERSRPVAEALLRSYPDAVIGGTGWDVASSLEVVGVPTVGPYDYSLYPAFRASIGFTQRGCRLSCKFCVVPSKEGRNRAESSVAALWRGEPYPRHLLLLDNDFFGAPGWRENVRAIREGGFRVCWSQGINARLLDDEAAAAIMSVRYSDDAFKRPRFYSAWDSLKDEERLFAGLNALKRHGMRPDHVMVYVLIGYWAGETEDDWLYRQRRLLEWGARPYPMPYVRNHLTVGFQRWCVGGYHKRISWADWKRAKCQPKNLGDGADDAPLFRMPLRMAGEG